MSELILYQTADGKAEVRLRAEAGSVWLSQGEIAELFATTKQNVSLHAANVLKEGELVEGSVVKEFLTTASDVKNYRTKLYRLATRATVKEFLTVAAVGSYYAGIRKAGNVFE